MSKDDNVASMVGRTRKPKEPKPATDAGSIKYTDTWLAEWFQREHGDTIRWIPERKSQGLITWSGTHWVHQADDGPARYAAQQMIKNWKTAKGDDDAYMCKARTQNLRGMSDLVNTAKTQPEMRITQDALDADPYELNTPDGIINLKTGDLLKHSDGKSAEHWCTKITAVGVDFEAPCPRWEKFLAETFAGNEELIGYMQRLFGVAAIGTVLYHLLPFLFGVGANGKTVILEVARRVLGTYATVATGKFLVAGRNNEHEAEIAKLVGARMVICSEVNEDSRFDEQKVKNLTGGEALDGRYLYGQSFTFAPSHTLFLVANHQPAVTAGGPAIWRRLRLIPFDNVVPEDQRNEHLADELIEKEGPAILAWIIKGAIDVAGHGLQEPESVKVATAEYAESEDIVGQFISENIIDHRNVPGIYKEVTGVVYARYVAWCKNRNQNPKANNTFGRDMANRGYTLDRSNRKRYILDIELAEDPDETL